MSMTVFLDLCTLLRFLCRVEKKPAKMPRIDQRNILIICYQTATNLDLLQEVTDYVKHELVIREPDRYWTLLGDRHQDSADYIEALPNWTHRNRDNEDEDRVIFTCYVSYCLLRGTLNCETATALIQKKLNDLLDLV